MDGRTHAFGARAWAVAVTVLFLGLVALFASSASGRPHGAAKKHKHLAYCTKHKHPKGCVKVPPAAKRPPGLGQQGPPELTPDDVEFGGGVGGGPGDDRGPAMQWALSQQGQSRWAWYCERFIEEAYGEHSRFESAVVAEKSLHLKGGSITDAPAGTLVYFAGDKANHGFGHVGISLGDGRMVSALSTVTVTNVVTSRYWRNLYRGWSDAPADWKGRIPLPPGPTLEDPDHEIRVTAPAVGSKLGGTVDLRATASEASGVAFYAYYASDPTSSDTLSWHPLGVAQQDKSGWAFSWDTTTVPDQGNSAWGTINVVAVLIDDLGAESGTRDYRRFEIDNRTGQPTITPTPSALPTVTPTVTATVSVQPTTTPTVTVTTPVPTSTPDTRRAETAGGNANTWTNYMNAGGTQGPTIVGGTTVLITCRLEGFRVSDGNTWWYRIASNPWNNAYYVSADAFYNNGATSGSLSGTPFVDPAVPAC